MPKQIPQIIPLGDRVLVELISESQTAGGLHLPEKQIQTGIIKAIGAGVDLKINPIKIGDKAYLPRGTNTGDKIIDRETHQVTHLVIPIAYISALIKD